MLPAPRYSRLKHHKYSRGKFNVLKMAAIYGANGAGKSNLVHALASLQRIIINEEVPSYFSDDKFKFWVQDKGRPQILEVEFLQKGTAYLYSLEIKDNSILSEELYRSGLGSIDDVLLYRRKSSKKNQRAKITSGLFEKDEESKVLKSVIEKNLLKPNKPLLKLLTALDNKNLVEVKKAYSWFANTLHILSPDSKPSEIAHAIDSDEQFRHYANNIMCSFNLGIQKIKTEKTSFHDFFKSEEKKFLENIIQDVEGAPNKRIQLFNNSGDAITVAKDGEDIIVKQLMIEHGRLGDHVDFRLDDESDGTIRLLDFIPAFKDIISDEKVYVIDEIERSIHPLLIKGLVQKFSLDTKTKGQLIFTTHESNLLDQEDLRQDEIWFTEKDLNGGTDIYSLSDFKIHNTIDIRKGYLAGRYGSVPFLGNLSDLNWHEYVESI